VTPIVGLAQPAEQLVVQLAGRADPDPVAAHAGGGLEPAVKPASGQVQPDLQATGRAGPHRRELFPATKADIGLLQCRLDVVSEVPGRVDDGIVERPDASSGRRTSPR
jgi:hypothetical protein